MNNRVYELLKQNKINDEMYTVYMLFEADERGRDYFNKKVEELFMEEAVNPTNELFAWHDGRGSILRDIKRHLYYVKKMLEEFENE